MMNRLFALYGDTTSTTTVRRPRKGAIIGAGQVGMACAYSMLIQSTFDEMVLVDVNRQGVNRIVQLSLSPEEERQLKHSAQLLRQAIEELEI